MPRNLPETHKVESGSCAYIHEEHHSQMDTYQEGMSGEFEGTNDFLTTRSKKLGKGVA